MPHDNLGHRATTGFIWSALQRFGEVSVKFVVGIILARLLAPEEFGLLAMVVAFVAIGTGLSDAGFKDAVIQNQRLNQKDLSSVFYFNLLLGGFFTAIIWLMAPYLAGFYRHPELESITRFIALVVVLQAFGAIHESQLVKALKFRKLMQANLPAFLISGPVAIILAYRGWGVWALAYQVIFQAGLQSVFLSFASGWRPTAEFSPKSITKLFAFGSRLALAGFLNRIYENIYVLIIGRVYAPADLGFYQRAHEFKRMGAQNFSGIVGRVMFPVYSAIQDEPQRVRRVFIRSLFLLSLVSFPLMALMAGVSEPLILTLIGDPWLPAVPYLQLLCVVGAFYPIHAANLSILKALGESRLFLRIAILKKVFSLTVLFFTFRHGIEVIILGQVFLTVLFVFLNGYFNRRLIHASYSEQFRQIAIPCMIGVGIASISWSIVSLSPFHQSLTLILGTVSGVLILFASVYVLRAYMKTEIDAMFRIVGAPKWLRCIFSKEPRIHS